MDDANPVLLIPLDREHLDASRAWANDRKTNIAMLRALPASRADQERWYAGIDGNLSKMVFAILWKEDRRHIGNTGLYHIDWLHRRAEFWILIGDPDYRGKKAGGAATRLMQKIAFDDLGLNRLYLRVDVENAQAIALYEKQGFTQEGVLREESYIDGHFHNVLVMSKLKREHGQKE